MGGTNWSDSAYHGRAKMRSATGAATFAFHDDVKSGKVAVGCHDLMKPNRKKIIESRDSDAHPNSTAVAVLFDVTGSMSTVPGILQGNLPKLMSALLRKGYLADPQILIAAIGDATCDSVPLQVGEFESGIEIEDCLTRIYLEGGGGGQKTESYELGMYFLARHTALDCFEKRGRRGYAFFIGDETPYAKVSRKQVQTLIGDTLEADIDIKTIVKELQSRYDSHFIIPAGTSYYSDDEVLGVWKRLFGQNVHKLDDPSGICECIASIVGLAEGAVSIDSLADDLLDVGADKGVARSVSTALAAYGSSCSPSGQLVTLPDSGAGCGVATL